MKTVEEWKCQWIVCSMRGGGGALALAVLNIRLQPETHVYKGTFA